MKKILSIIAVFTVLLAGCEELAQNTGVCVKDEYGNEVFDEPVFCPFYGGETIGTAIFTWQSDNGIELVLTTSGAYFFVGGELVQYGSIVTRDCETIGITVDGVTTWYVVSYDTRSQVLTWIDEEGDTEVWKKYLL